MRAFSVYDAEKVVFTLASQLDPSPSEAHINLIEELDRSLTIHWTDDSPDMTIPGHWSNGNPFWSHDNDEPRVEWLGDVLSMALKCNLDWYLDAVLQASPGRLQRPSLPLLAYALHFDTWMTSSLSYEWPDTRFQSLLNFGANPNEKYLGHSV